MSWSSFCDLSFNIVLNRHIADHYHLPISRHSIWLCCMPVQGQVKNGQFSNQHFEWKRMFLMLIFFRNPSISLFFRKPSKRQKSAKSTSMCFDEFEYWDIALGFSMGMILEHLHIHYRCMCTVWFLKLYFGYIWKCILFTFPTSPPHTHTHKRITNRSPRNPQRRTLLK